MHNSMKFFSFFVVISAMLCSCYSPRYVYSPSTQNIPLLNKKNDLEFSAFYAGSLNAFKGKGNYNRGFDIQSAWAVSNHFALMVNESARWEKNGANDTFFYSDSSSLSYKRNFTEFGFGYFSLMHHNAKMKIQLFGGAAFGGSKISDDYFSNGIQTDKYHNSKVIKIFVQPALIYSPTKNFSGALTSRFTEVIFAHINTNYTLSELDNYILDSLNTSPVYFWEPAVSYTFGFKRVPVKIRIQGSITILINHRFVEHRTGNLALGVVADISQRKKIKEPASKN